MVVDSPKRIGFFCFLTRGTAARDPNQDSDRFMVLSNIKPSLCRDNIITRIGINPFYKNHWTITGSVKFGDTFHFTGGLDRDLIVDTGAGGTFFPQSLHQTFRIGFLRNFRNISYMFIHSCLIGQLNLIYLRRYLFDNATWLIYDFRLSSSFSSHFPDFAFFWAC